ncbi:MAG: hypothetical protein ACUVTM_05330 [Candidatus Bathyarchaeia archaeon]
MEVSRTHPACQFFSESQTQGEFYRSLTTKASPNNSLGLHARNYIDPGECEGPDPEYCTVYCPKYWSCKLVLDKVRGR